MANIKIPDLHSADCETFFEAELSPEETVAIIGGGFWGSVIGGVVGGVVGGPVGAIFGAYVGNQVENSNQEDEEIEVHVFVN